MEVDGISVAKATAIENASVVSGAVNGVGHLILTTKGGTAIDAGPVNSPNLAETITNKTIALGSNTVSGTKAQFNTAMTDDDFVSLTGSEAPTNKDLSSSSNIFPAETDRIRLYKAADQSLPTSSASVTFPSIDEAVGMTLVNNSQAIVARAGVYLVTAALIYHDGGAARRTCTMSIGKGVGGGALADVAQTRGLTNANSEVRLSATWVGAAAANDNFGVNAFADTTGGKILGVNSATNQLHVVRIG